MRFEKIGRRGWRPTAIRVTTGSKCVILSADCGYYDWQEGLSGLSALTDTADPRHDNLAGHKSVAFVCWLMVHGIMPLYTPWGKLVEHGRVDAVNFA